jgi:UDP-glucose 4-epimerase
METRGDIEKLRVAVTGATGDLGRLLLPLLLADPRVESVHAFGVSPPRERENLTHRRLDLTRHDAERDLVEALSAGRIDALYHLAFLHGRRRIASHAHEVEVAGTIRVLSALARRPVKRLILPSLTALYGARGGHPAQLDEDSPLAGCPASRFVSDKVEVERLVQSFRDRHPETPVTVLRFAPILGPTVDNPATRFLGGRVVPTLLGFDPLWQAIHEEDAAQALHRALHARISGAFNVVGKGVAPLSGLIRQAGGRALPLPRPVAHAALRALNASGAYVVPIPLLDYIQYSWVADGARAQQALGFVPRHHVRDAVAALRRN